MKGIRLPYLILFLMLVIVHGCAPSPSGDMLRRARSVVAASPDSAIAILDSVDRIPRLPESDRMRSRLLRVEAGDRKYVVATSDSVIKTLLEYYIDGNHDRQLHPTVLYYAGRTYSDLGRSADALRCFKQALALLGEGEDPDLESRIHAQIAGIFLYHHAYANALIHTKLQIACEEEAGDSLNVNSALFQAFVYRTLGETDSAEYIYRKFIPIVACSDDSTTQAVFMTQIADFLRETDRFAEADSLIGNYSINTDSSSIASISIILNEFDERTQKHADLEKRCRKMLESDNIYSRRSAYRNLARIYQSNGNIGKALEFTEKYRAVAETISANEASLSLNGIEELADISELEDINALLSQKINDSHSITWLIIVCFSALFIAASILYIKHKKNSDSDKLNYEKTNSNLRSSLAGLKEKNNLLESRLAEIEPQLEASLKKINEGEISENDSLKYKTTIQEIINRIADGNCRLTEDDFKNLEKSLTHLYPRFMSRLLELNLGSRAFKDSMLIKIGISQKDCAEIFHRTPSAIANSRSRLLKKLSLDNDFKNFTDFIQSL